MSSDRRFNLSWVLPCEALEQLSSALQQTARTVDQAVLVLTEAMLPQNTIGLLPQNTIGLLPHNTIGQPGRFCVVVSRSFSGLLQANPTPAAPSHYRVQLTFAPKTIAAFLAQLSQQSQPHSKLVDRLHQAVQQLQANDPDFQSEFTLRLTALLMASQTSTDAIPPPPHPLEQRVAERTQELHDALAAAQAANRTKTEFLAAMSHELRTPLTCIIGMADTLLRVMAMKPDTYPLQPQKQQEYLTLIKRSGEHLLELITDILDLSQVEAGKVVLNVKAVSLTQIAHQSLQLLQERARSKGVKLTLKPLEPNASSLSSNGAGDDFFTADPRRVSQILLNLLSNAIKFTPAGGRVTLRFGTQHDLVIFQVEDTGIGISDSQRSLLFQKFQQLDSSLTRAYEGTGLGLALTKQLVELHSGRIEVNSTIGVGSIFTVWLPAQPIAHLTAETSIRVAAIAADVETADTVKHVLPMGERVVLVEDHDETALLICDLLTAAGCQVVWMIDDATAIRQIELLHPCLVIANVQMIGTHGDKIIRFVRQHPALQTTKILVLTPAALPDHHVPGADDYLTKPVEPYQLLAKLATLVGRK